MTAADTGSEAALAGKVSGAADACRRWPKLRPAVFLPYARSSDAAVLAPADVHLAAHMCATVSRWYAAALLEGRDDVDLLALGRALARFLEAHDMSPREVLDCYGRDPIGQQAE